MSATVVRPDAEAVTGERRGALLPQGTGAAYRSGLSAPDRSLVQRREALQRANEIRCRRAQLKRDLKAGRQPVHGLLLDPPDYLLTMKVYELLLATPRWGRVKVNKILSQCRISPSKTLGGMTSRQRQELRDLIVRRR